MKNKLFNIVVSVIGLLIALLTMLLLLMNDFLPVSMIKTPPIFIFLLIELMLLITAIQMLFAKLLIAKLAALPYDFSDVSSGIFLNQDANISTVNEFTYWFSLRGRHRSNVRCYVNGI